MLSKKTKCIVIIAILVIFLIVLLVKIFNVKTLILRKIYPKTYSEYVEKYAKECDVDPLLIFSMIKAESNFDKEAKSSSGAQGLMQLMEATATEIANKIDEPLVEQESLLDPEKNIMIGTKYYSELLKLYDGNMLLALTAYKAGIGKLPKSNVLEFNMEDDINVLVRPSGTEPKIKMYYLVKGSSEQAGAEIVAALESYFTEACK